MNNAEKTIDILNDLVRINHDRVEGYEKAAGQLAAADVDLKAMFLQMAGESKELASELTSKISSLGGDAPDDTTVKGKIYRAWMDVKNTFTGSDRTSILESCEYGEDAAQKAYKEALDDSEDLDADSRELVMEQKAQLKKGHDTVKRYRDMEKASVS